MLAPNLKICFFPESRSTRAHPVTNLLLRISRHTAVNFCTPSTLLFFEGSLDRGGVHRRSQHRPDLSPLPFLPTPSLVSFSRLSGLSQTLFSSVHLYFPPFTFGHPQTHRGDGNVILFPAGFNIGFSGTSVILIEM